MDLREVVVEEASVVEECAVFFGELVNGLASLGWL